MSHGFKTLKQIQQQIAAAPPREWVVDGLLLPGSISAILAAPKVGKSVLARQLALCVATGQPFLGRETKRQPVLLVNLEDDEMAVHEHFSRMANGDLPDNLLIRSLPTGLGDLEPALKAMPATRLVVIDMLAKFGRLENWSEYGPVSNFMAAVETLARTTNSHIMMLHHTRKSGGDDASKAAMGSTAIVGSVSAPIMIDTGRDGVNLVSCERPRLGVRRLPEMQVSFDESTGWSTEMGYTEEALQQAPIARRKKLTLDIIAAVQSQPSISRTELHKLVKGYSTAAKDEATAELVTSGEIVQMGTGRKGSPHIFTTERMAA
jgi:hypothetical protein